MTPIRALLLLALSLPPVCVAQEGAIPIARGRAAPVDGVLLDRPSAQRVRAKLLELKTWRAEAEARSAQAAALTSEVAQLRTLVDAEKSRADDWKGLAAQAQTVAAAERRRGFLERIVFGAILLLR